MQRNGKLVAGLAAAVAVAATLILLYQEETAAPPALSLVGVLSGSREGFRSATELRRLRFPTDHGPHPDYRSEWWYFAGNLETRRHRHFGFQLTFFRSALAPTLPPRASRWSSRQAYMAHFALTDSRDGTFHAVERLSRGALGLAGAGAAPFAVWVHHWSARALSPGTALPMRLRASGPLLEIDLILEAGSKPPVLQGDRGLSRKGPEPGNASYYYSLTRLPTHGSLRLGKSRFRVQGSSWLDREWSTGSLGPQLVGWDWFGLQLDDGRELMYYRLRGSNGEAAPTSGGTLVGAAGQVRELTYQEVELEALDTWRSPATGVRYPCRWRLSVPAAGMELEITPYIRNQELNLSFRYWEGAVRVQGEGPSGLLAGRGYVELTGYDARRSASQAR